MKRSVIYLAWWLWLLCGIAGCGGAGSERCAEIMDRADAVMEADQDSALVSLAMLDGISPLVSALPKSLRMRYNLLYAKAMNKGYMDFTSDSIMLEVVDYYDLHGSNIERLEAYYLLGCVYRDLKDSPKAISYLYHATDFAGEDKFTYLMLNRIHSQMAELYMKQAIVGSSIKEYDLASHYAWLAGDTVDAIVDINFKSIAYALINQTDSAITLNDKAIKMFKDYGYNQYAAQISGCCLEILLNEGEFNKAKEQIELYEQHSGYYNNGEIAPGHETYYYEKGLFHLYSNQIDSAKIMFTKCAEFMDDPNMKVMYYRGMCLLYDIIQKPDSTAKYAMLAYEANDSAYQINAAETLLRLESAYNYSRYQEEARIKAEDNLKLQTWIFCLILAVASVSGISVFLYRKVQKRNRKSLALMNERYETEKTLLQHEMEELNALLEEKESLFENKELLFKQKHAELNEKISEKEQSISELQERVAQYERDLNIKDTARLEDEIQTSSVREDFAYFADHVTKHPTARQWKELEDYAKANLPQLYMLLNNYNVSQKELRICILARLKFKPGEIATITDCRFPEVSLTRSRLLKKIYGIDNGKAADFDKRIMLMY